MISNLCNIEYKIVTSLIESKSACIYLIQLDTVINLNNIIKNKKKYDNDDMVYHFGFTNDINTEIAKYMAKFEDIGIYNIQLSLFGFVDPLHLSSVEVEIKNFMIDAEFKLNNDTFTELAVIPKNKMSMIKKQYEHISTIYGGHIREVTQQMKAMQTKFEMEKKDLEHALENEKHKNEVLRLKNKIKSYSKSKNNKKKKSEESSDSDSDNDSEEDSDSNSDSEEDSNSDSKEDSNSDSEEDSDSNSDSEEDSNSDSEEDSDKKKKSKKR
jgi:hypothetical protein